MVEALIMAHRYLYYVKWDPVISDYEFDRLEKSAREQLPESSPVHGFGSDCDDSYTDEHRALAKMLISIHRPTPSA